MTDDRTAADVEEFPAGATIDDSMTRRRAHRRRRRARRPPPPAGDDVTAATRRLTLDRATNTSAQEVS